MADRSKNLEHINVTNHNVVTADWMFTTPTIIFQPISGIWMANIIGLPLTTFWISASIGLYILAGVCWLPVVWLQIRLSKMSQTAIDNQRPLPCDYWMYTKIWFWLGVPAFISMVLVIFLMVFKSI